MYSWLPQGVDKIKGPFAAALVILSLTELTGASTNKEKRSMQLQ